MPIIPAIAALHAEMADWRRDLHAHPETAFEEHRTAGMIAEKLTEWGIEVHCGIGGTGVVGVLRNGEQGRRIGLRADMDALAIAEGNTFSHASRYSGKFHGCGHDGHVAMLLGAARYLAATRRFSGTVVFIFQPAEEGQGGARKMLADGLFDRFPCDEIYAMHNRPTMPLGQIAVLSGPVMAAADEFRAHITGRGGHAANPHLCVDPVVAAAHLVTAWQPLVSRRTDPLDAVVISVTEMHAGNTFNVIPAEAFLGGTARSHRAETRERLSVEMAEVAHGIARAFGVEIAFDYLRGYPATVNHQTEAVIAAAAARLVVGDGNVRSDLPPAMGAEDFAYMLEARPGAYIWVGQAAEPGGRGACSLHSPNYDFNDDVLPIGASLFATLVEMSRQPER
ncbi:MAG TPA: M20 aminoacylase family protein [Gallionella sp.]|nr:M20 aminoacylase family protein [Gallionella sp.]